MRNLDSFIGPHPQLDLQPCYLKFLLFFTRPSNLTQPDTPIRLKTYLEKTVRKSNTAPILLVASVLFGDSLMRGHSTLVLGGREYTEWVSGVHRSQDVQGKRSHWGTTAISDNGIIKSPSVPRVQGHSTGIHSIVHCTPLQGVERYRHLK